MIVKKDTTKEVMLQEGKDCKKCGRCCNHGSGFILESELKQIADFLNISEEELKKNHLTETELLNTKIWKSKLIKEGKKPYGPCTFLKNNICEIQPVKSLHCRICHCRENGDEAYAWFLVNKILNKYDPESIRQYNSYIKTNGLVLDGGKIDEIVKDKKLLKDILSYKRLK